MSFLPKNSVVVPIDFSNESIEALEVAKTLVADCANLHIIHVLPPLIPAEPGVIWETVDDQSRRMHAEAALKERLHASGCSDAKISVDFGDAARQITQFAEALKAEMIVIPSHGRTGLSRFFLGSTAERVVRLAHCPVLVLRK